MWKISNNTEEKYKIFCLDASSKDDVFNNFKTNNNYTPILEHVGMEEGEMYIKEFEPMETYILSNLEEIKKNDSIGNPLTYSYDKFGQISPTTLRYIKNCCDILQNFKGEKIENVVEIGGGYGGLCFVYDRIIGFKKYHIYDLPEVNELSKKYLSNFTDFSGGTSASTLDGGDQENYDLLISNYALSELSRNLQIEYIHRVLKKSKMFYLVFNQIGDLSLEEFLDLVPEYDTRIEEEHSSFLNYDGLNKIIYGHLKKN
jgi:hypothetical protein